MGIVGKENATKKGIWMSTFEQILEHVDFVDKVIDIVKLDIEVGEYDIMKEMDLDYWCKYVKQFYVENHPPEPDRKGVASKWVRVVRRLEKCFSLFHRDTRFFRDFTGMYGTVLAEFQPPPHNYKVNLNEYRDELDLVDYMVTFGELYFLNRNFLVNEWYFFKLIIWFNYFCVHIFFYIKKYF